MLKWLRANYECLVVALAAGAMGTFVFNWWGGLAFTAAALFACLTYPYDGRGPDAYA